MITSEAHFVGAATEEVYTDGPPTYAFWSRYLEVFAEVVVLARVRQELSDRVNSSRCNGPGVSFLAVPDYSGPWGCMRVLSTLMGRIRKGVADADACLARVPGILGSLVWREAKRQQKLCALEVLGDPWSALGPGSWPSPLRPVVRRLAARQLRKMCQGAAAINYVTTRTLQKRYPPGAETHVSTASDALTEEMLASPEALAARRQRIDCLTAAARPAQPFRIGFVGSLSRLYKGPDILLRAAQLCQRDGLDFELLLVGEGRHTEEMRRLALRLGLADRVQFLGQIPFGMPITKFLDSIDLFTLPSRDEGLPRALLEAMSRGCPCIASRVGGVPELLPIESTVKAGNVEELAHAIKMVALDRERLKRMSRENLERARQYAPEVLSVARRRFLQEVKLRATALQLPSRSPQEVVW